MMKLAVVILCLAAYTASALDGEIITANNLSTTHSVGIMGGRLIDIQQRPYTVSLFYNNVYHGTGVLVDREWVLTAAFNVLTLMNVNRLVRIASENALKGGELVNVSKVIVHPGYSLTSWMYDLALLKLSEPVKTSKKVKTISIASKLPKSGAGTIVTGYGGTNYTLAYDGLLREAVIPFIPYSKCAPLYKAFSLFSSQNICASKLKVGPCPRDCGAPLVYKNKVIGIFSGSVGDCGSVEYPGVYSDVTQFKEWILAIIRH